MPNIKWTEQDIVNIANLTRELRLKDFKPSLLILINQAQRTLLPPEKCKLLRQLDHAKDVVKMLEAAPAPVVAPVVAPNVSVSVNLNEIVSLVKDQSEMIELAFYQINDVLTLLQNKPVVEEKKKKSLKNVLIIGLLNNQANIVKEATKTFTRIKVLDTDRAAQNDIPQDCEYVILMKKFINHVVYQNVQNTGKTLILHEGGIKTLIQKIKEL